MADRLRARSGLLRRPLQAPSRQGAGGRGGRRLLSAPTESSGKARTRGYLAVAVALFLIWSNSFIAASYLLGGERPAAQFTWDELSAARFAPLAPLCLFYCFVFRRRQSLELLRRYPVRLPVAGLLAVPAYNLALYFGQQHGIPPPVAALTSALTPLFLLLFAALTLGERLTLRKGAAFFIALAGLFTIALSRGGFAGLPTFGVLLAITALAPLSWSIYTILGKAVVGATLASRSRTTDGVTAVRENSSPLDWTYLTIGIGSLPLLAALPWHGGRELLALRPGGWLALFHLTVLSALVGYAVWSWLLRHLPASTVAFFVFLNPPLTMFSKLVLSVALPQVFAFRWIPLELAGSALALAGLAIAIWPSRVPPATWPASGLESRK